MQGYQNESTQGIGLRASDGTFQYRHSLTNKDFVPGCLNHAGQPSDNQYEKLESLLERANSWLRENNQLRVISCQCLDLPISDHDEQVHPHEMFHQERYPRKLSILRLWLVTKDDQKPSQIGCVQISPECLSEDDAQFESYRKTIVKYNKERSSKPIPGQILSVITERVKADRDCRHLDTSYLYCGKTERQQDFVYVDVVRVFYEIGEDCYDQIGYVDFPPGLTNASNRYATNENEEFGAMMSRARLWMATKAGIRVVSVQSLDLKFNAKEQSSMHVDAECPVYKTSVGGAPDQITILRLYFVRSFEQGGIPRHLTEPCTPSLSHRTFVPVKLSSGGCCSGQPTYEDLAHTMYRINAWLNLAEKEAYHVEMIRGTTSGNPEKTWTLSYASGRASYLFVVRVYMEGDYREPLPAALPPQPEPNQPCCCCCTLL